MRIAITGASGFIGQHLLEELGSSATIRCFSRIARSGRGVQWLKGDISNDADAERLAEGTEVLINMAAELKDAARFKTTNIDGTHCLIRAVVKQNVKRVVHLSSVGVVGLQYSRKRIIVDESSPNLPVNEYEKTKLMSEQLWIKAAADHGFDLVVLRPTNVFGEGHPRNYLLHFLQHIAAGRKIPYTADATLNYLYVKDLSHAIAHVSLSESLVGIFNVGEASRFELFCQEACREAGVICNGFIIPDVFVSCLECLKYFGLSSLRDRLRSVSNRVEYSEEKLRSRLSAKFGWQQGLRNTILHYRETGLFP